MLVQRGDGKVLLVKRLYEPGKGRWALPGGLIKPGEKVKETAIRESKEETGLNVKLLDLVGVYDIIERDERNRIRYHFVTVCFRAKEIGGVLRPGTEIGDVRWFSPHELKVEKLTNGTRIALKDSSILAA